MTTEPGLQKLLEDRRTAILEEFRKVKPDLVREFLQLNTALRAISQDEPATQSDEYFGFRSPIEAILKYLDKVGRAVPKERIAKDLEAGGYGRNQIDRPYWTLIATINYHLEKKKKTAKKKAPERRIVERNGLIGKSDWPEEKFTPEGA